MATQKPIASISYNSVSFLKEKLDTWCDAHIIQSYMFIQHKGEDGDKDHIHFRVEPNKKLDPMDLQEDLKEYNQSNPTKPLCVRPFRPSKEEDWILYGVHDEEYMRIKYPGDKDGKIPYNWQDIVAPEFYDVEVAFIRAKASMKHSHASITKSIQDGKDPLTLIKEGENPFVVNTLVNLYSRLNSDELEIEYRKVCDRLKSVNNENRLLRNAIEQYGLTITKEDDGSYTLV